jgi:hypothetical protein
MGHLAGYEETTSVYVETRQEDPPSAGELMDANETLAESLEEAERLAWELASAVIQAETLADAKRAASKYLGLDA